MSALIRNHPFNDLRMQLYIIPDHSRYHKNHSPRSGSPGFFSPHILTNLMMSGIEYRTTDINEIDLICPLWIQLNDYMLGKAGTFRSHYEQMTFDERKAYFEKVAAAGTLHLDLAFDPQAGGKYVGYCVSSLSQEKTGEIESIFVEKEYRSREIGSALVIRALAWFDEKGSVRNRIAAGAGNEGVWDFYKKFGFYPRMMVLEQKKE